MTLPPHAPYEDVDVGEPIEIRVFLDPEEENMLVAECSFRGDKFGGKTEVTGSDLERVIAVDELVQGVALLVWHELLGTPVFREEDERWTQRVEARAAWERLRRNPENGWVTAVPEHVAADEPVYARREEYVEEEPEIEQLHRTMGDAHVEDLRLSQEEMAALARGEIPEQLVARMMRARSVENLLESVERELHLVDPQTGSIERAQQELEEVLRRFRAEGE